jgi:[ribosomal protein S5]-alanine N-acetyltransferase
MLDLNTSRCRLLPVSSVDVPNLARLYADPAARRYLGGALPSQEAEAAALRFVVDPARETFTIRLKKRNEFVGFVSLSPHCDEPSTEISYMIDPSFWRSGLAREAAAAVLTHAFDRLGLIEIIAETQAANTASRRLLERLGMTYIRSLHRFGSEQVLYIRTRNDEAHRI